MAIATDLRGYAALAGHALRNAGLLRRLPYRRRFLQVFLDTARMGFGDIGVRSAGLGTLIIAGVTSLVTSDPETAVRLLVQVVMREVGPMIAALIVLVRVGMVLAARLGLASVAGDTRRLALDGIAPRDYLLVPAVLGIAAANVVLTFYFQLIAIAGGLLGSAALMGLSIATLGGHLLDLLTPVDIAYTAIKSFAFGLIIATVCAYCGSATGAAQARTMPATLSRAVMQSLFVMSLFNAAFGYFVYGVLLFGIVRAQN
ncbi:ABC transporter permease [Lysobacter xanthus]